MPQHSVLHLDFQADAFKVVDIKEMLDMDGSFIFSKNGGCLYLGNGWVECGSFAST